MLTNNLGLPRIGFNRELKKACEKYWAGKISQSELFDTGEQIRRSNLNLQLNANIDLISCNDFSFYDHVLDTSLMIGNIPQRYLEVPNLNSSKIDLYFAMARGYQVDMYDVPAMEMTKWFDTNYHYIVPEFKKNQKFSLFSKKVVKEFIEAKKLVGKSAKPVLLGPVSYLLSGKEKVGGFHRIDLIEEILSVYLEVIRLLYEEGAEWLQIDEPYLCMDLSQEEKDAFIYVYNEIEDKFPKVKILLATYFESLQDNLETAVKLPVKALHIDVTKDFQYFKILGQIPSSRILSLGLVDGRNIWKNEYERSIEIIRSFGEAIGYERIILSPSCSLLHVPYDLELETKLKPELKIRLSFAKQKLSEISDLYKIINGDKEILKNNRKIFKSSSYKSFISRENVQEKISNLSLIDIKRKAGFIQRQKEQKNRFKLPLLPTTTIGSFPQTTDIRKLRSMYKKGNLTENEYQKSLEEETRSVIKIQEEIGLDILVHGEFERNDMVEYFGEQLEGFAFTEYGWVQSYGSRCVKPPIIFGDVERTKELTVKWSKFAQSLTDKPVKGMLTGPVTILQWSFVRIDQPRSETAMQIALAIREEVLALEKSGISIIQIDEPALREGLPLKKQDWDKYLDWAVKAFQVASSGVKNETQIHTHMCYCEFNDIIKSIAELDADVITIEASRSQMELLESFNDFKYPNEIGPGVYDIHSPRIPSVNEIMELIEKASQKIPLQNLWVNPDCGLKTRGWVETIKSLKNMVEAARQSRIEDVVKCFERL